MSWTGIQERRNLRGRGVKEVRIIRNCRRKEEEKSDLTGWGRTKKTKLGETWSGVVLAEDGEMGLGFVFKGQSSIEEFKDSPLQLRVWA